MMMRTHLALVILAIMLFLPSVSSGFVFIFTTLIATLLPDIDSGFSSIGKMKPGRFIQFFVRHRGIFHSFTLCIIVSALFAIILPIFAFPFFLGYSMHLLADSFTVEGIRPFWPLKAGSSWKLRTGSKLETTFFICLVIIDFLIFIFLVKNYF